MNRKIIHTYWGFVFINALAFSFFFATSQLFLKSQGMNLLQINIIGFVFVAAAFILEIPTGSFADTCGRGRSVATGCFIIAAAFLIYFFATSFWMFILAEIIGALGITFISGALDAWMVDALKHHHYTGKLEKIYADEGFFRLLGLIIGSLSGAYLGETDLSLPWLCSAIGLTLSGFYALLKMRDYHFTPRKPSLNFNWRPLKENAKSSIQYGIKHRSVFYIVIFGAVLAWSLEGVNKQWALTFTDYGLSVSSLGLMFNGVSLAIFLGGRLAILAVRCIKQEKRCLILTQVVTGVGLLLAGIMFNLELTMIGFYVHEVGRGLFKPLKSAYLNRRLRSQTRATVLSFDSMIGQLGSGLGLLTSGVIAEFFSISLSWIISGAMILIAIPIFLKLKNGD